MGVLVLARLGLVELWRNRLVIMPAVVALLLAVGLYATNQVVPPPTPGGAMPLQGSIPWVMATSLLPFLGAILGVLAAAGALSGELERGTAVLLATRQPRWVIVVGKALGVIAFLLASFLAWGAVLGSYWVLRGGAGNVGQLLQATLLGALPGCLAGMLALAFSTRVAATASIAGVVLLYLIRAAANTMLEGQMLVKSPAATAVAQGLQWIVPSDRLGEVGALVAIGPALTAPHLWALIAPIAWLAVAVASFARRDLAG